MIYFVALTALAVHIVSECSKPFSDFFNRYIGSLFRGIPATITSVLPFSLAETLIIFIPVLCVLFIVLCIKRTKSSIKSGIRYVASMAAMLAVMYSMFVFTTAVAYNGSSLGDKLGLDAEPVSVEELRISAEYMIEKMNAELPLVEYKYADASVMPYSLGRMNTLLLDAYRAASDKYSFLPRLYSRLKPIALSEAMTYTHISGIFTYYTGEANLNINFPDYTLPFTAAHELAHQRGIMPENEANFAAFLVCIESDDPYIRYSGYLNMYEYINSALHSADYDTFKEVYSSLDRRVKGEIKAYNAFFEKYRENTAANVAGAMNDTYLKSQGVAEGEKSLPSFLMVFIFFSSTADNCSRSDSTSTPSFLSFLRTVGNHFPFATPCKVVITPCFAATTSAKSSFGACIISAIQPFSMSHADKLPSPSTCNKYSRLNMPTCRFFA